MEADEEPEEPVAEWAEEEPVAEWAVVQWAAEGEAVQWVELAPVAAQWAAVFAVRASR